MPPFTTPIKQSIKEKKCPVAPIKKPESTITTITELSIVKQLF